MPKEKKKGQKDEEKVDDKDFVSLKLPKFKNVTKKTLAISTIVFLQYYILVKVHKPVHKEP